MDHLNHLREGSTAGVESLGRNDWKENLAGKKDKEVAQVQEMSALDVKASLAGDGLGVKWSDLTTGGPSV